jgi:GxxExxY protein
LDNELKFGTITSDIIQSAHEVKKILGIGFLESVYEKALFVELKNKGYDVKSQSPI